MSKMHDEIMEQPDVLAHVRQANADMLDSLAKRITQAGIRHVVIAARGTSNHCAIYIKYLVEILLGLPVSLAAPSVCTLYGAKLDYRDALVIAVSQSGMAEDALAIVKDAKKGGGITVAMTNDPDSPVSRAAEFGLDCVAGTEESVAATKTFTAQMYCLALLVAKWAGDCGLQEALRILPDGLKEEVGKADAVARLAREYTFMSECYVLGRGLMYPIALEAALKMMETTYVNARGFAVSDFQHGPLALLGDNTPVFVYCSDDEASEGVVRATEQYKRLGAYVVMFTNHAENARFAQKVFLAGRSCKYTAPFHLAVLAQLFSSGLADAKRRTPDAPRNIKKITITK